MIQTRTDAVIDAIRTEIERRRLEIDADGALARVEIVVKLDARNGRPFSVAYRTESVRQLREER